MSVLTAEHAREAFSRAPCWTPLLEDSGCRVCLVNEQGVLVAANECASLFFQRPASELVGVEYAEAFPGCVRGAIRAWQASTFAKDAREPGGLTIAPFLLRGERWVSRARVVEVDGGRATLCVSHVDHEPAPVSEVLQMVARVGDRDVALGPIAVLTDRELEVALLIASGMTDIEISRELHRSTRTVHAHRRSIGRKLRVETRSEILRIMVDRGMIGMASSRARTAS